MDKKNGWTNSTKAIVSGIFLAVCLFASSCQNTMITNPKDIVFPDSNVSYQNYVQPLFNLSCTFSGCHNDDSRAWNLSLTYYGGLLTKPGLIIPGKPDQSILYQIIAQKLPHSANFQGQITTNHINGIHQWILEGAKNN